MKKIITYEKLRCFTYSNDRLIKGEVQGIVLNFLGLGFRDMIKEDPAVAVEYAERGVIYLIPYYNPWSWMNRDTVAYVDELIDVLCAHYGLHAPKIVSSGVSMGGLCALVYCAYATVTPVRCVTNCPVCDLVYHFDEREAVKFAINPATKHVTFARTAATAKIALKII